MMMMIVSVVLKEKLMITEINYYLDDEDNDGDERKVEEDGDHYNQDDEEDYGEDKDDDDRMDGDSKGEDAANDGNEKEDDDVITRMKRMTTEILLMTVMMTK